MRDFLQGGNFSKGLKLSAACLVLFIPNLAWKYFIGYSDYVQRILLPGERLSRFVVDIFMIWVAMQISATAGYAWAKGPRLAGAGNWNDLRSNLKLILILGIAISAVEAVFFDFWILRPFFKAVPRNPFTSCAYVVEELICRFGILIITYRLTGSITASVLAAAVFNVGAGLQTVYFAGARPAIGLVSVAAAKAFVLAVFFGYFFARKGLLPTMALRFIIGLKFAVYAFIDF